MGLWTAIRGLRGNPLLRWELRHLRARSGRSLRRLWMLFLSITCISVFVATALVFLPPLQSGPGPASPLEWLAYFQGEIRLWLGPPMVTTMGAPFMVAMMAVLPTQRDQRAGVWQAMLLTRLSDAELLLGKTLVAAAVAALVSMAATMPEWAINYGLVRSRDLVCATLAAPCALVAAGLVGFAAGTRTRSTSAAALVVVVGLVLARLLTRQFLGAADATGPPARLWGVEWRVALPAAIVLLPATWHLALWTLRAARRAQ